MPSMKINFLYGCVVLCMGLGSSSIWATESNSEHTVQLPTITVEATRMNTDYLHTPASVFRVDISSIDEISMSADVEQRVTGAFKVDCPPDSVSASFISHESIRFSIDSARDDVSLSLFHVPVFNANIVADIDRVSMFLTSQMALSNLSFARDAHPDNDLAGAVPKSAMRFSRGTVSTGTAQPSPSIPIHFSR